MKGCWILSKIFFFCLYFCIWLLSLILFMDCIAFTALCILNHPCIPGMRETFSWSMIFLMCNWNQFANWEFLQLCSLRKLSIIFYGVVPLSSFGICLCVYVQECFLYDIEYASVQCSSVYNCYIVQMHSLYQHEVTLFITSE
jgi:hypothetical protein